MLAYWLCYAAFLNAMFILSEDKKDLFICSVQRWPDANYEIIWRLFQQKITSPCPLTFKFHLYSVPIQLNLFCWLHMQTGLSQWPNFISSASAVVNFFRVIKRRCLSLTKTHSQWFTCSRLILLRVSVSLLPLQSLEFQTDSGVDALLGSL